MSEVAEKEVKEGTVEKNDKKSELIIRPEKDLIEVFSSGQIEQIVAEIKNKVSTEFKPDMSTAKGRKEIASMARKVGSSKTYLDDLGKSVTAEWKAKAKKVDNSRKFVRDELDAFKKEVRAPLTEWEEKEKERVKKHEDAIQKIKDSAEAFDENGEMIDLIEMRKRMRYLDSLKLDESWEEFLGKAKEESTMAKMKLNGLIKQAEDKAELERKAAEAEKKRLEEEKKAHEEKLRKEAEEKAKRDYEEKMKKEKEETQRKYEEKLRKEKEEAEKAQRAQKEKEEKLQREKEQLEKEKREYEEKKKREAEEIKRKEEQAKKDAELKAQKEEVKRKEREQDVGHRKLVNREILGFLVSEVGLTEEQGKALIVSIVNNRIPHTKITYYTD